MQDPKRGHWDAQGRVRPTGRRSVKCSRQAHDWTLLGNIQKIWETTSRANLQHNCEATLFVANVRGSHIWNLLSLPLFIAFLLAHGWCPEEDCYTLQIVSNIFTHSLKGLSVHQAWSQLLLHHQHLHRAHSPVREQDKTQVIKLEA